MLVLVAPLPVRRAIYGEGDADRGFNPRDGGATPARRRAPRAGGRTRAATPPAPPRAAAGVLRAGSGGGLLAGAAVLAAARAGVCGELARFEPDVRGRNVVRAAPAPVAPRVRVLLRHQHADERGQG